MKRERESEKEGKSLREKGRHKDGEIERSTMR